MDPLGGCLSRDEGGQRAKKCPVRIEKRSELEKCRPRAMLQMCADIHVARSGMTYPDLHGMPADVNQVKLGQPYFPDLNSTNVCTVQHSDQPNPSYVDLRVTSAHTFSLATFCIYVASPK